MSNTQRIHPPYLALYCESIRFHCECALHSVDFVASFIDMTNETKGNYEMTAQLQNQVLDNLQNILIHGAALSRYFWPSHSRDKDKNKIHSDRACELKQVFNLTDDSPLKNRELRNQLEHFDENLDLYFQEKPIVGYVIPAYVGGYQESEVPIHFFRAYFIDSGIFNILGKEFKVQPIVDEIHKIYSRENRNYRPDE